MKKTRALAHQVQKVKILCLDLDGTLINTLPDIASAVNDLRVHLGLERLPSEVESQNLHFLHWMRKRSRFFSFNGFLSKCFRFLSKGLR